MILSKETETKKKIHNTCQRCNIVFVAGRKGVINCPDCKKSIKQEARESKKKSIQEKLNIRK